SDSRSRSAVGRIVEDLGLLIVLPPSRPPTTPLSPDLPAPVPVGADDLVLCGACSCCARPCRPPLFRAAPSAGSPVFRAPAPERARPQPADPCGRSELRRGAVPAAAAAAAFFRRRARHGIDGAVFWPDGLPRARARHDRARYDFCFFCSTRGHRAALSRFA